MADLPNGNGYKALAMALGIGILTGGGVGSIGTYTVAADYAQDITNIRIDQAVNDCRLEQLQELLEKR